MRYASISWAITQTQPLRTKAVKNNLREVGMKVSRIVLACALTSSAHAAPPAPPPAKADLVPAGAASVLVVSCDPGGCWDEYGMRYDAAGGGVFIRRDGKSCQSVRGRMICQ